MVRSLSDQMKDHKENGLQINQAAELAKQLNDLVMDKLEEPAGELAKAHYFKALAHTAKAHHHLVSLNLLAGYRPS